MKMDNSPDNKTPKPKPEYRNRRHGNKIVAGFREQRDDEFLLDVTLRVGDVTIKAHKILLASFSPYFKALFKFEPIRDEFELHGVDGESVALLIDYAYSGDLNITTKTVQNLMLAANFFDLESVCDASCSYMKKNMSADTCLSVMELATILEKKELHDKARRWALEHFEDVTQTEEFLTLSEEVLTNYLKDDDLVVTEGGFLVIPSRQDELVREAIEKYVSADFENRKDHLADLLSMADRSDPESYRLLPGLHYSNSRSYYASYRSSNRELFDDTDFVKSMKMLYVTGVKIFLQGHVIRGVRICYCNGTTILHGKEEYGIESTEVHEFHIEPYERIISVNQSGGYSTYNAYMSQIPMSFTTNTGRVFGPYGHAPTDTHRPTYQQEFKASVTKGFLACFSGSVEIIDNNSSVTLNPVWGYYQYDSNNYYTDDYVGYDDYEDYTYGGSQDYDFDSDYNYSD